MEKQLFLGLDLGTTNIKALLVDSDGKEIAKSNIKNPSTVVSNGYSELSMEELFDRSCTVIKNVLSGQNPNHLAAMSVSGQGEGLWALDEADNPIGPAILWNDNRASRIATDWLEDEELNKSYLNTTGSAPFSGATPVILSWLKRNNEQAYNKIKTLFWCKDWIRFCLTGERDTDLTDASTSMLNLANKSWAYDLFNTLDLNEVSTSLPQLKLSDDISGHVLPSVSERTGLPEGLPVAVGALDIVSTAFGMGAHKENDTCVILGTTCCCESLLSEFTTQPIQLGGIECFSPSSLFVRVNATMAGTPNIDWAFKNLLTEDEQQKSGLFEYIESNIQNLGPVPQGVIYHPYISGAGERSPFINPGAKAQFFGIDSKTSRWDLIRSIYEGVAFSIRDCIGEGTGRIFLSGGGSQSGIWPQIIADCTGRKVLITDQNEACSIGSIMYAYKAVNSNSNLEEIIARFNGQNKTYIPNIKNNVIYQDYFTIYQDIRNGLNTIWKNHNDIKRKSNERFPL